ncbi:MAG TPA: hypothetical protein VKV27_10235, partial [Solirubrobacteraceae bacterium]|nr:hypothetical protein [Solirubrobacteraceae bacterium]
MAALSAQQLERSLADLLRRERELLEAGYVRRSDGAERVREALRRLGAIGSPAGVVARAASELGASADFDLVLVSGIEGGRLCAQTLWLSPE